MSLFTKSDLLWYYQYCNLGISSNIYCSFFQVFRSFKKLPLPKNGFGTFNSTGIVAVSPTIKEKNMEPGEFTARLVFASEAECGSE